MKEFELKNTDPEDIEDLLVKVEKSFGIEFSENELVNFQTFGELCDHIKSKIQLDQQNNWKTLYLKLFVGIVVQHFLLIYLLNMPKD